MHKILDEEYYDLITDNILLPTYNSNDITPINDKYSILHVARSNNDICNLGLYLYHQFPSIFTLNSTASLDKSGVSNVQRNPYLALFGLGVLVGVIDTGIDYQHPAFRNSDNTSRIAYLWDQTIQDGPIPEGFVYGTEYNKETINQALQSDDPLSIVPSTDPDGHGTAIASIMAGTPSEENSFSGIAPQAEFVVVKLKEAKQSLRRISFVPEDALCFQETDIMLGIRYLISTAERLNRPIAVCIALGTSQGGHDEYGATSSYITTLSQGFGLGISVAAGNEGNKRRHYFSSIVAAPYSQTFELKISAQDTLFAMEIWTYTPGRLNIELISPTGESTQLVYPRLGDCNRFSFVFHPSVVWINNFLLEKVTGDQLILIRFQNPMEGIWRFQVHNMENEPFSFHSWLPSGELISDETFFLNSSPDTTVTSPANAPMPLSVTAYNQINNSILITSSRGFTRNNQVTPDIAAPGYELTCALPGNRYGVLTGSGAATAHASGIVAMLLEWAIVRGNYPYITGYDINRLIARGSIKSPTETYPNNIWGYGQINIDELFNKLTI